MAAEMLPAAVRALPAQGPSTMPATPPMRVAVSGRTWGLLRTVLAAAAAAGLLASTAPPAGAQGNTVGGEGPSTLVYPPYRHTYGIHKARTPHLRLFLGDRTVFADPQGLAAVKLAEHDDPKIKGDDFQLTLFGLNAGRGEIIYNSSMQTLAIYGTHGSGEGQFDRPRGIAADVHGRVYVADTGNRRVARLTWKDRQLRWSGTVPGTFVEPWGVAAAPEGAEVFVSDRAGGQVYRWTPPPARPGAAGEETPDGAAPAAEGSPPGGDVPTPVFSGGIDRPTAIAVLDRDERWLHGREDALFVVHGDGATLSKFDGEGRLLARVEAADLEPPRAPAAFGWIAADYYGNVWVTDAANGTIWKFDRELRFLTRWGETGDGEYQLDEPRGIAIWKRFGQVFVAERQGAQYFFVGTDVRLPDDRVRVRAAGPPEARRYAFDAFFTDPTELTLRFLDARGAVVDSLTLEETLGGGAAEVAWEADPGAPDLASRAVRIAIEPRPTYSSRRRFFRRMEREIAWDAAPPAEAYGASPPIGAVGAGADRTTAAEARRP
ncbi:MAG TPA: NHL repeat-containing protein [Gemmatimonadota bacterium]